MNVNEIITEAFIAKELITIDPGKSNGGIVKYHNGKYQSWPIKKMCDFEDLVDFFKLQKEECELPLIFIERITTFQGDYKGNDSDERNKHVGRAFQMDKLKRHYSELISAIKLSKIPYIQVMPASWQKLLKIHIPNEETAIRKRRFKDIALNDFPGQKIVGWNADAFLLIEFARMKLKYDQRWINKNMIKPKVKERTLF